MAIKFDRSVLSGRINNGFMVTPLSAFYCVKGHTFFSRTMVEKCSICGEDAKLISVGRAEPRAPAPVVVAGPKTSTPDEAKDVDKKSKGGRPRMYPIDARHPDRRKNKE